MVQVLGAVAQLGRSIIRELALAGQVAAYNRGVRWVGRAPKLSPAEQLGLFRLRASGLTLAALALRFNVADSTISRYLTPPAPSSRRVKLPVLDPLVSSNDWRMIGGKSIKHRFQHGLCFLLHVVCFVKLVCQSSTAARFGSSPAICASLIFFSMVHVVVPAFQFDACCCLSPGISAGFAGVPAIALAFSIVKTNIMVSSKMVR